MQISSTIFMACRFQIIRGVIEPMKWILFQLNGKLHGIRFVQQLQGGVEAAGGNK
jgi:hypothetical protein